MIFEPQDLRSGESGQHGVAKGANGFFHTAQGLHDRSTFGNGRGIAPELGGADNLALRIERDESVLLATYADRLHFGGDGACLAQGTSYATGGRLTPGVRMLFLCSRREVRNQFIFLRRRREHFAVPRIDHQDFGRLGAAINTNDEASHGSV
jgi:hypothetical protein